MKKSCWYHGNDCILFLILMITQIVQSLQPKKDALERIVLHCSLSLLLSLILILAVDLQLLITCQQNKHFQLLEKIPVIQVSAFISFLSHHQPLFLS